jgi:cobalt/nickel transport system permease protein
LRHVQLEQLARRTNYLHSIDPRAKIPAVGIFLIALGTVPQANAAAFLGFTCILLATAVLARLPFRFLIVRASAVLPFSLTFALISWLSGDTERALSLAVKSYLSALAVLLLIGTTPLPDLLRGLESMYVPRTLLTVVQFLYRYLFVVVEQATRMSLAAQCRGGGLYADRKSMFKRAAGVLSVLFARSYGRAEGIHHSMLARGFNGQLPVIGASAFRWTDGLFLLASASVTLVVRLGYATIANH